jgi:V/A-type H+-transporting ATPase subunit B
LTARLHTTAFPHVTQVEGPLIIVEKVHDLGYHEVVEVESPDGRVRRGQVIELHGDRAVVEVFAGTSGLDVSTTKLVRRAGLARAGVGSDLFGRILSGSGEPVDGRPPPLPSAFRELDGLPLNPAARDHPSEFIQTGISAIDGLNTVVRGQKLPIFSGFGLPAAELAVRIANQASVPGQTEEPFAVVFAAMGITRREASFFRTALAEGASMGRTVVYLNLADDPTIERLLTPRLALTTAEYLAFELGMQVLVLMTDMTSYCEALREVATAREEVPGRRGFPGYMYTDLAGLYERAGRVRGRPGSVTQLILLSMPDDDITHPIPDLTGYITEGQLVLSRELHRRGVAPPIDVLPSLSRLMNAGIGAGRTREDHRAVADQLYACYARGKDLRRMVAIIGEAALSDDERRYLEFADAFEQRFVGQGAEHRTIAQTLDLAWALMAGFPPAQLKRIPPEMREKYGKGVANAG